ncbi:MAG: glycosyltransferase family 4 [Fluviicola sp.]|jgi:glycosyltransferase involved in cell wall biosynthesis|uniref:glycosyltransferase n=1 Tax=Fluviicola sp. TaxID=1917219 RepID=UPI0026336499|nr:glycosyltransferase [Fluviicola sp.]MDF3027778.1 glycosyltransferase family 4 [Fluviicola sp.]
MKPRKIGIVVNDLIQGGVSQFLLSYCNQLDYSDFEYQLIVLGGQKDPFIEDSLRKSGIKIIDFNIPYYNESNSIGQFVNRLKVSLKKNDSAFNAFVKDLGLDLLFAHCHIQYVPYLRQTKLPVIFVAHLLISSKPANPVNFLIQKSCYSFYLKNTTVITVSESVTRFFHEFKLVNRLTNLYHCPNKTILPAQQINYREKVERIVYVARISTVKNHSELLKAWAILNKKEITLQLIGPNELNSQYQSELAPYLAENIDFLGNRSDVSELLLNADIAVFPSKSEGLPLALLEKMAYGLPVVISDIPQLTSIIRNDENGLVYSLGNPTELAAKLEILISDCEKRSKLGNAARQTVLESYAYAPGEPLTLYEKKINELI